MPAPSVRVVTSCAYLEGFGICIVLIRTVRVQERCRKQKLDAPRGLTTVVGYLAKTVSTRL